LKLELELPLLNYSSYTYSKMPALDLGYASSDEEEQPQPSTSELPEISASKQQTTLADPEEEEDDEAVEAAARADAFGLASSSTASRIAAEERKSAIASAPDVLKEDPNVMSNAIITRPTDMVMNVNISYADMQRPVQGPDDPFNQKKNKGMNSLAGML
jgi:pre-mRNA-processing factor 17